MPVVPIRKPSSDQVPSLGHLPEGVPDAELVGRARAGDRSAESLLYRRHAAVLLSMATRLLRSSHSAEDTVQDAFVRAFERLAQLKDPALFRPWLLSIVVSLVRKRLRHQRLLTWVGLDSVAESALEQQARPGTRVEARGELRVLDAQLRKLPAQHALAWSLRYIEGEKLEEIASAMHRSLATTKRYIAAAEREIRAHVRLEVL